MDYCHQGKGIKLVKYVVISPFFLLPPSALAFDFITDNELSFGRLAIPRNNVTSTVTVTRTGRSWSRGSIFILEPGTPGEHTITGLAPYTNVSLSVSVPVESVNAFGGPTLRITDIEMQSSGNADINGEFSFFMGATLSTSGNGESYISGATYNFYIPLEITF